MNNKIKTVCHTIDSYYTSYYCCNKICNNSLSLCDDLIKLNQSGACCNITECTNQNICNIICENCTKIINTFEYDAHQSNITFDCHTNVSCIDFYVNNYNTTCWYDKRNISDITFNSIPVGWYTYYIVSLLCFFLIMYIPVILVFTKYYEIYI